eukprot:TRINITY_DN7561_c0_g2_i7.p1 TRINITY_DN7561_c0_g2~~TRINITY_DN7561_c0_g2_i7.p1  ORF type:complete len:204 (-),score=29.20 TRINITY_DN7561_c0_g2_i7:1416-2027(-)
MNRSPSVPCRHKKRNGLPDEDFLHRPEQSLDLRKEKKPVVLFDNRFDLDSKSKEFTNVDLPQQTSPFENSDEDKLKDTEEFTINETPDVHFSFDGLPTSEDRAVHSSSDSDSDFECEEGEIIPKKCFEDFLVLKVVGEGAYGKVYQVRCRTNGKIYAMKVLKKQHLLKTKAIENTIAERNICITFFYFSFSSFSNKNSKPFHN